MKGQMFWVVTGQNRYMHVMIMEYWKQLTCKEWTTNIK